MPNKCFRSILIVTVTLSYCIYFNLMIIPYNRDHSKEITKNVEDFYNFNPTYLSLRGANYSTNIENLFSKDKRALGLPLTKTDGPEERVDYAGTVDYAKLVKTGDYASYAGTVDYAKPVKTGDYAGYAGTVGYAEHGKTGDYASYTEVGSYADHAKTDDYVGYSGYNGKNPDTGVINKVYEAEEPLSLGFLETPDFKTPLAGSSKSGTAVLLSKDKTLKILSSLSLKDTLWLIKIFSRCSQDERYRIAAILKDGVTYRDNFEMYNILRQRIVAKEQKKLDALIKKYAK